MSDWGSTAVEGSVGAVVVCFLLSCITRDGAGRDFGARCACFLPATCRGVGDLSLSDAIWEVRGGRGGGREGGRQGCIPGLRIASDGCVIAGLRPFPRIGAGWILAGNTNTGLGGLGGRGRGNDGSPAVPSRRGGLGRHQVFLVSLCCETMRSRPRSGFWWVAPPRAGRSSAVVFR